MGFGRGADVAAGCTAAKYHPSGPILEADFLALRKEEPRNGNT